MSTRPSVRTRSSHANPAPQVECQEEDQVEDRAEDDECAPFRVLETRRRPYDREQFTSPDSPSQEQGCGDPDQYQRHSSITTEQFEYIAYQEVASSEDDKESAETSTARP